MDRPADLALIFRNAPYRGRAPRADLDLALAAAALDLTVEIYLLGPALLQLAADLQPDAAGLPAGYRAWAALPELTETVVYGEKAWVDYFSRMRTELILPARALSAPQFRTHWRRHDHAMVI